MHIRIGRRTWVTVGAVSGAALVVVVVGRRTVGWLRRLATEGARPADLDAALPGDELLPGAACVHLRAVEVQAPPAAVWRWLPQIGQDRSGFFSYTRLENLVGCRMPEVHDLRTEWSMRSVGDVVWLAAPDRAGGEAFLEVAEVLPERALVLVAPGDRDRLARGEPPVFVWQLCVLPGDTPDTSRLLARSRYAERAPGLEQVHAVMELRMLRTIARLAERDRDVISQVPVGGPAPAPR